MIDSSMPLLDDFDATTYIRALITVVKMDGIKPIERQYVEARAALLGVETGALWDEDLTDLPPIPDDVSLVTRRVVVRDCILMACIDDDYTDRERERVHQIAAWLSVDVETCDRFEDWFARYFDMMDEQEALLEGFDPPWD